MRTARWKYSVRCPEIDDDGAPLSLPTAETYIDDCLYDLKADPWELTNLAGYTSHAHMVEVMRERLRRRMIELGEEPPRFGDAQPVVPYEHIVAPRRLTPDGGAQWRRTMGRLFMASTHAVVTE